MTTGEKIAVLRKKNGITQEQLAELLNVSRQSVSRWEMDVAFPEIGKLVKLCKLLTCSVDYLLTEDSNETEAQNLSISVYDCYKFIRECGYCFLATAIDNKPNLRPMGWIHTDEKALYFATDKRKLVYSELVSNPQVEIASYNISSRRWMRIAGKLESESSNTIRKEMLGMYPIMRQKYIDEEEIFLTFFKMIIQNIYID